MACALWIKGVLKKYLAFIIFVTIVFNQQNEHLRIKLNIRISMPLAFKKGKNENFYFFWDTLQPILAHMQNKHKRS